MKRTDRRELLNEYVVTIRLDNAETDARIWAEDEAAARKLGGSIWSHWTPDGTVTRGQVVAISLAAR